MDSKVNITMLQPISALSLTAVSQMTASILPIISLASALLACTISIITLIKMFKKKPSSQVAKRVRYKKKKRLR